jgi:uncharacterized protein (DUF924 family)
LDIRVKSDEILKFWFGHIPGSALQKGGSRQLVARVPFWAGKWGRMLWDVDARIRNQFGDDLVRASRGEFDHWAELPTGRLALILLLDQFSRNIHRGNPAAFADDARTLKIALAGLDAGEDMQFYPVARSFYYLPLVHQEDPACQEQAVALYSKALREARGIQKTILFAEYCSAVRHRQVIRRFGRFPHRNRILGRMSTAEERRFLREPFSHF